MEIISFADALRITAGERRHLLLGNGFSIALFPEKFVYKSLLDQAIEQGTFNETPEIP